VRSPVLMVVLGLSALIACNNAPTDRQPDPSSLKPLGALEIVLNGGTATALARMKPLETLADSAATFTSTAFTVTDTLGIRYFNATFSVKNNTANAFKNLSLVMYNKSTQNIGGTAIKDLQNEGGVAITDISIAQRIKPANGMSTPVSVDATKADFQSFTTAEASSVQSAARTLGVIGNSDTVLEYGYVARKGTARGIGAGETGQVTLSFRVPKTDSTTLRPYRFAVTAVIFDAATTRVTRSREESAASAAARAAAITDRSNPTEVVLVGADTETSSCTNCTVSRRANAKISSAGNNLLDNPSDVKFTVESVKRVSGVPWSLKFAPDGQLYFTIRGGDKVKVALQRMDVNSGSVTTLTDTGSSLTRADGEGGVLGLELDPDFATNNYAYICYSYWLGNDSTNGNNRRNRISRFTVNASNLTNETVLFDNMLGWSNHNGCRVANGTDGKLYFSIGDAADYAPGPIKAQDPATLAGKIFRINYDGSIPTDNPQYTSLTGSARALWTFGHRNPQGLAFQPGTGALWSTEHGQNTRDELNLIQKGKNYGWPSCVGTQAFGISLNVPQDPATYPCATTTNLTADNYQPAAKEYNSDATLATSDIAFSTSPLFPEWNGNILMATLKANRLYRIELNGSSVSSDQIIINSGYGRLRDITVGPNGFYYLSTDGGDILRMVPQ
jgi:aldose sugar dehydrogenase